MNSYETLTSMVVPRSSKTIQEDLEFGLHSVTVFKKVVDEYKLHAREKRYSEEFPGTIQQGSI